MNKQEIKEYLKKNLEITVKCEYGDTVKVHLYLDGEEISSSESCLVKQDF